MGRHRSTPNQLSSVERRGIQTAKKVGQKALIYALSAATIYTANSAVRDNIDIGNNVPQHLPVAVEKIVNNAVYLSTSRNEDKHSGGDGMSLSGVYLGHGDILSAGHALKNTNNRQYAGMANLRCGGYLVSGVLPNGNEYENPVNKAVAIRNPAKNVDYAMFKFSSDSLQALAETSADLKQLPEIQVATTPPKVGETVYFINWEPTASNEDRDPFITHSSLQHPAIYPGVVKRFGNNVMTVITDFRSYPNGGITDANTRPGGSGGIVVNEKAQLVGLSNMSQRVPVPFNFIDRIYNFQIGPFGLPDGGNESSIVTMVNLHTIEALEHQVTQSAICSSSYIDGYPAVLHG